MPQFTKKITNTLSNMILVTFGQPDTENDNLLPDKKNTHLTI